MLALLAGGVSRPALAQQIDLSHGGPINITAKDGIEWLQAQQEVIATGDAQAIRGNVTVTADRLIAWYRKKPDAAGAAPAAANGAPAAAANDAQAPAASGARAEAPAGSGKPAAGPASSQAAQNGPAGGLTGDEDTGGNEVYRVQAEGHVHIFTQTDQVWGDNATYDLDQSVLVVTGKNLRLTTPNDVLTARDDLEYWSQRHMAVARGDAVVVTNDGRRLQADTLVAYTVDTPPPPGQAPAGQAPHAASAGNGPVAATQVAAHPGAPDSNQDPLASAGRLQKVDAFGHVIVRTVTDTVTGDRAVYVPDTGIARIAGQVRITRGQNQLNGSEAIVDMHTGVSRLVASNSGRVQGLVVPNDQTNQALVTAPGQPAGAAGKPGSAPKTTQPPVGQPPGGQLPGGRQP